MATGYTDQDRARDNAALAAAQELRAVTLPFFAVTPDRKAIACYMVGHWHPASTNRHTIGSKICLPGPDSVRDLHYCQTGSGDDRPGHGWYGVASAEFDSMFDDLTPRPVANRIADHTPEDTPFGDLSGVPPLTEENTPIPFLGP